MIDKLVNLVKETAGDDITKNAAIPDRYKDEATKVVGNEIVDALKSRAKQGNVQELVSLFKSGASPGAGLSNNPIVKSIGTNVAEKFASKFGVPQAVAGTLATGLVPKVLSKFISKTNDPNDHDFELQDVMKNLTGKSDVGDMVKQFTSGIGETVGSVFGKK